jgi:hypothetical protein
VQQTSVVTFRPLGNPLPLGFLGLAGGTLVLSGLQLRWVDTAETTEVGVILLVFPFTLQLITSIFGFLRRETPVGMGMGVLAGTWASIALVKLTSAPGAASDALGLLLLASAAGLVLASGAAGASGTLVPAAVLGTAAVRFGLTALYQLGVSGLRTTDGIVGLVLAAAALGGAGWLALDDVRGREPT